MEHLKFLKRTLIIRAKVLGFVFLLGLVIFVFPFVTKDRAGEEWLSADGGWILSSIFFCLTTIPVLVALFAGIGDYPSLLMAYREYKRIKREKIRAEDIDWLAAFNASPYQSFTGRIIEDLFGRHEN